MSEPMFKRLALIGIGLIGSSIARAVQRDGLVAEIVCAARSAKTRDAALSLGLVSTAYEDPAAAVKGADLVIICTPLGAYAEVGAVMVVGGNIAGRGDAIFLLARITNTNAIALYEKLGFVTRAQMLFHMIRRE